MPTIYKAKADGSNAVRYIQHSLVRMYLDMANFHSLESIKLHEEGRLYSFSVIGIVFSAMSLEAFLNEISEDIIPDTESNDFNYSRGSYKTKKKESSIGSKCRHLFKIKHDYHMEEQTVEDIERLVDLRNSLVHYKPTEMSTKLILPPARNGTGMFTVDFTAEPVRVEPPLIQKITGDMPARCFNTSLTVIRKWGELSNIDDIAPDLALIKLTLD